MDMPDLFRTTESEAPAAPATDAGRTRLAELADLLRDLDEAYYGAARPATSDAEYDALRTEYDDLAQSMGIPEEERYTDGCSLSDYGWADWLEEIEACIAQALESA